MEISTKILLVLSILFAVAAIAYIPFLMYSTGAIMMTIVTYKLVKHIG